MQDHKRIAASFVNSCRQMGWDYAVERGILRITKRIPIGDNHAFANADMEAFSLLGMVPLKGGSVWGTDGGSIGGMSAMNQGLYRLNKSGTGKRILDAIMKL